MPLAGSTAVSSSLQAAADRAKTITVVVPKQKFKLMIIVSAEKRKLEERESQKEKEKKKRKTQRPAVANEDQRCRSGGGLPLNLGWVPMKTNKKSPSRKMNEKGEK